MFRWLMLHGDMFPCLHFVLEADCKSAKDSSMNWLFPKVNPIEGQIEGQKSASCTAKLVRYIFYARSRAWQRLLAHSSQVFDDTSMDMMKKPRPLMSKKVICHVIFVSFIFLPSCIWNLGATTAGVLWWGRFDATAGKDAGMLIPWVYPPDL